MPPIRIKSITEYHRRWRLPKPEHPLFSVIDLADVDPPFRGEPVRLVFDFYCITMKRPSGMTFQYGQHSGDFDEGVLFFMAPGQVFGFGIPESVTEPPPGWIILMHPDFIWGTSLARTVKQYTFFDYSVKEALYLSEKEEAMINGIVQYMAQEYHGNIDQFTQRVLIAQVELLLTYADRFYHRQFLTRKTTSHELLVRLEDLLDEHFRSGVKGLPTVTDIAATLHVTPNYLSSMLKALTGRTAQQHLHDKLIALAKEKLSTTGLSVSEIAYELGFEHLQSFSKLFKAQTSLSPMAFRQSFETPGR